MYSAPSRYAMPVGWFSCADEAGPQSPRNPGAPVPATARTMPSVPIMRTAF